MPDDIRIRCLQRIGDRELQGLSDVLIDLCRRGCIGELHAAHDPRESGGVLAQYRRGSDPR